MWQEMVKKWKDVFAMQRAGAPDEEPQAAQEEEPEEEAF